VQVRRAAVHEALAMLRELAEQEAPAAPRR
jgi:hypothetical protein